MFVNSIRWRLQLWHGLLLVIVLVGFGFTAYQLQRSNQLRRIDQELQRRMAILGGLMRRPPEGQGRPPFDRLPPPGRPPQGEFAPPDRGRGPEDRDRRAGPNEGENPEASSPQDFPREDQTDEARRPRFPGRPRSGSGEPEEFDPATRNFLPRPELRLAASDMSLFAGSSNAFYYILWTRDGRLLSRSDSAPAELSRPARGAEPNQTRMRGTLREMYRYGPPGECILVGRDIGRELADMRRFAGVLLGAGGAVLVLGLAGGWWVSTRAIRPIKDISATASKIAGGDLSQRVPMSGSESELDQLATVLNSTFGRLETAFAQQTRFTSDAAHELRTPVSVMLTQTQSALARERPASEYRETVEACQRAAQRMRRLIESLLELARLDADQEQMKRSRFDLAGTAAECIDLVRPLAAERGVSIRADLAATECLGDPDRLGLVITNLLTNAIHYNREGGEIHVSSKLDGGLAILTVTDTGQGILSQDLPHIFERFWRADQSRSRADGRAGLGLAIAKSIVDAHGGTIEVASEPGRGSAFMLRLPAVFS